MRFTRSSSGIDIDKAEREVMAAIEAGVNYLDTAYIYQGSEAAVGEILSRNHCRDQVNLATKLPHYMIKSMAGVERIFQEELMRLRTDHIDYYLMHMLTDISTWEKLIKMGIGQWIKEKMASGAIRNIGFSYHGNTEMFKQLLDVYDWDFCQIQYNYLDEHSQAGREGLQYANAKGVPVIIMEPLRGGRLVNLLPDSAKELLAREGAGSTPAALAFRWLYNQPEVTCVLSGMNTLDMVQENIKTASASPAGSLTAEEQTLVEQVKAEIEKYVKVGCTGCRYCMPCPNGVDIPAAFLCYNAIYSEGKSAAKKDYMRSTAFRKNFTSASQCIECGKCETHCPQGIEIRKELKNAARELEGIPYKAVKLGVKIFHLY